MMLHRQMSRAADRARQDLLDFRVERVLDLLSDDRLRVAAASASEDERTITLECNFIEAVWDDSRVTQRIEALARQDITVEKHLYEYEIEGQPFQRWQLRVAF